MQISVTKVDKNQKNYFISLFCYIFCYKVWILVFSSISLVILIDDKFLISKSDEQDSNAHFPISFTDEGIVICLILLHSQKQY